MKPFQETVEDWTKGPPYIAREVAVLLGPALAESEVRTGTVGRLMTTVIAFDTDGPEAGLLTVTVAVPTADTRLCGTEA
jgi:hypothetical protein